MSPMGWGRKRSNGGQWGENARDATKATADGQGRKTGNGGRQANTTDEARAQETAVEGAREQDWQRWLMGLGFSVQCCLAGYKIDTGNIDL